MVFFRFSSSQNIRDFTRETLKRLSSEEEEEEEDKEEDEQSPFSFFAVQTPFSCCLQARRKKPTKPGGVSSSTGGLRCGGRGRGRGFLSFLFLRTGKKRDDDVQTRTTLERRRRRTFFEVLWLALNRRVCFGSSGTETNSKRDAGTRASSGIVDRDRA